IDTLAWNAGKTSPIAPSRRADRRRFGSREARARPGAARLADTRILDGGLDHREHAVRDAGPAADRERAVLAVVSERESGDRRLAALLREGGEDVLDLLRRIRGVLAAGKTPDRESRDLGEHAGVLELHQHAVDAIGPLADVLEKEDRALRRGRPRRAAQRRHEREVPADERAFRF